MANENVSCILATAADLPVVVSWMEAFYREQSLRLGEDCTSALKTLVETPKVGRVLIVWEGEQAVGYFVLTFGYSLERGGRTGLLDELYIVPEARGRGIGTAAIDAAICTARDEGCCALHLEVDQSNERARRLYEGAGFIDLSRYFLTHPLD